jgi:hypothetical protein
MASQAYYDWIDAGSPYTRALPTLQFRDLIRSHGYTVYDYPNQDHLTASRPEDHTPFSATGWPVTSARWVGHAVDIMPPTATAITSMGAMPLPSLARRIIAAKDAKVDGTQWIKYLNWTDELDVCRREDWRTGTRVTYSSTDKGHIHISARSDMDHSNAVEASGWDPLEDEMTPDEMVSRLVLELQNETGSYFKLMRGVAWKYPVTADRSMLSTINGIYAATAENLANLNTQLAGILAAALDDGDTTVILPPDALQVLQAIQAAIEVVPTAEENADAVVAQIAS